MTVSGPQRAGEARLVRVRKAYEQIGDQLRELIINGTLRPGQRLPREHELASQFGVSRTTVREALRLLSAEGLIRTAKGAAGGSFVTRPTADHVSEFVSANLALLANSEGISLDELLEVREQLEVPAARLAAERRSTEDIQRLNDHIPENPGLSTGDQFSYNKDFHSALVEAAGNALLTIAAQPIFVVLQTNLRRSMMTARDLRQIHDAHVRIAGAIERSDGAAAETEMVEHLAQLRPMYRKAWRAMHRERARS